MSKHRTTLFLPFLLGLYSILGLPKANRFFLSGLSVVLLHLFFSFFTLLFVGEQFFLYFFTVVFVRFFIQLSFSIDTFFA